MPLPSKVIVRDADGRPKLGPPQPPHGKRFTQFAPLLPDKSDQIRGGVVVSETLRTALSCVAPGGASHPALAADGATLRHSLRQFEYRVFLKRNEANPFHPSLGTYNGASLHPRVFTLHVTARRSPSPPPRACSDVD